LRATLVSRLGQIELVPLVIRKARLGEPEADFTPVRGGAAISLATRLTIESFSLAGVASTTGQSRDRVHVRFVPRTRA
jgi:hypothetical protein